MKILISNDDGIESPGIHALAEVFCKEHDILVVAPEIERSASSQALNSMYRITYKKDSRFKYNAYSCTGMPADCVKLGILHLMGQKPDLVLTGINNGTNLGSDVIYSGTVAAAFEGIYMGVPSIAVSTASGADKKRFNEIAEFVSGNLKMLLGLNLPATSALSINYPPDRKILGAKITRLGLHRYNDGYHPHGEDGYQLRGNPLPLEEHEKDCDIYWYNEGYVVITPVQNDRNDYITLKRIKGDF